MRIFFLIIIYTSCLPSKKAGEKDDAYWIKNSYVKAEIFYPEGMAGCSYLLKTSEQNYQPLNLHDSLHIEGASVWVKFHPAKETMSVCMMGPVVIIEDIQLRK